MKPSEERRFWRAVNDLKQAEALASLAGAVSGPADAPPTSDPDSWAEDYVRRGHAALKRARDWVDEKSGHKYLRERAQGIARHVKRGVEAVRSMPGRFKKKTLSALDALHTASGSFLLGSFAVTWLIPAVLVIAWLRSRSRRSQSERA